LLLLLLSSHYALELRPDLSSCTFSARVSISVTISAPTSTIQLNAVELQVSKAELVLEGSVAAAAPIAAAIAHDEKAELLTLTFPSELAVGRATLTLAYTGILNDDMRGFYCSKYEDASGAEQRIATTQFEATSVTHRRTLLSLLSPPCTLPSRACPLNSLCVFALHVQRLPSCRAVLG
jgi:aminopeptidase N